MFHVVTGGSGSGKSAFAEQCILDCQGNKRIYIATMYPFDEESHRRIARHRAMRAEKKFTTIERYTDLEHLTIPQGADVLLECMSNLTANEIYQEGGAGDNTVKAILNGIHHLLEQAGNLVVVTNEVFSDGITYDPETETYVFTDLLADVIVYPNGFVRVVDLDELADAFRDRLITAEQMQMALRRLDKLLSLIYKGAFPKLQKYIEDYEAIDTGN